MNLNREEILNLEKYYRINFINQLSGLKSPCLIGTKAKDGVSNLGIFNSIVHLGANPPCLGFVMRPILTNRNTYNNIKATNEFTINLVHQDIIQDAHHTSAKYPPEVSEFEFTDLSECYYGDLNAPYVEESKIKIGLSFIEEHEIKFNKTIFMVGQIEQVIIDDAFLEPDGHIMHEKLNTVSVSGLDTYYGCTKIIREAFARPKFTSKNI